MDFRPIMYVIGLLLMVLSVGMILPMLADMYAGNQDWKVFMLCAVITAFFGGSLFLSNAHHKLNINVRQAFMLTVLSWVSIAGFGALPFYFSEFKLSMTDAFFESMSGVTTTGSTVITGLDTGPPGILLWRGILQWLGGVGVVLMAMSIMPFLNVGGMQIFRTELSENEKVLPRAAQLASSIGLIYVALTITCMISYMFAGMSLFDAMVHAMTTISTGGFSTYDSSFGHYDTPWSEIVAITFMIAGGLPFVLYLQAVRGHARPLFTDSQVRTFLGLVSISILVMTTYLVTHQDMFLFEALRRSSFNVVSIVTGTGFANGDFNAWGGFAVSLMFFLMVIGACAGSTTCGIKIFRFQVLFEIAYVQLRKLVYPSGVFIARYNGKPIPNDVPISVMGFFFLYALCFSMIAIALSFTGLDFLTAMSGAATSISNVGPGLGEIIGPAGTFQPLPDSAKWICSAAMLLGRLEIFPILVMCTPHFWQR